MKFALLINFIVIIASVILLVIILIVIKFTPVATVAVTFITVSEVVLISLGNFRRLQVIGSRVVE